MSYPRARLRFYRRACLAAATATMLSAALTAAAALPAQAAGKPAPAKLAGARTAPARACAGISAMVRLHGRTFHVHRLGQFGIEAMRGHHMPANELAKGACISPAGLAGTSAGTIPPHSNGGLYYGLGPLEMHPRVYLDFWGSQWNSDTNGVEQYMENLFKGLGTASDTWSTTMTQYTNGNGAPITFNGSVLGGAWVDGAAPAPQDASYNQVAAEAQYAASVFGVSGPAVDIFVLSPQGTNPVGFPRTGFCAYHDWNGTTAYTNMPYVLTAGSSCGANLVRGPLDGFSIAGGHEYAEAVTDPEPPYGYMDGSGEEIGDLCAWWDLQPLTLSTGTFAMQPLWSNNANGCVQ